MKERVKARTPESVLGDSRRLFVCIWAYVDQVEHTVPRASDERGEILLPQAFCQLLGVGLLRECPDLHTKEGGAWRGRDPLFWGYLRRRIVDRRSPSRHIANG